MADEEYRIQYAKSLRPASDTDAFLAHLKANPHDATALAVLADYLEERGLHADDATLAHLRSGDTNGYVVHADGKVHAGPNLSIDEIRRRMMDAGSHWFDRDTMRFFGTRLPQTTVSGPAGTFFISSEQQPAHSRSYLRPPRRHTVRWYDPTENEIEDVGGFNRHTAGQARTIMQHAATLTKEGLLRHKAMQGEDRYAYRAHLQAAGRHADEETLQSLLNDRDPITIEDTPDGKVRVRSRIGE